MDETTKKIVQLVADRCGINIDSIGELNFQKIIEENVHAKGYKNKEFYLNFLETSPSDFQMLIEQIVVPETWFFRDRYSYRFLEYYVKNKLLPAKLNRPIKILSVPCSSGEEPYSIAMQLLHAGLSPAQFTVDAIDISQEMLKRALEGVYTSYSFRGMDPYDSMIDIYFERNNHTFKIKDQVKECVKFYFGNVLDENAHIPKRQYDIIFCKNFLIYMVPKAQEIVIDKISKSLLENGVIVVSSVEIEYLRKAGYSLYPYAKSYALHRASRVTKIKENFVKLTKSLLHTKSIQSIPLKKESESGEELLKGAKKLADAGQFKQAETCCQEYLSAYGPHATAYFILALIEHAMGMNDHAEEYFLKTIYLEPENREALVYLALLSEEKGELSKAKLFSNRAKRIIEQ